MFYLTFGGIIVKKRFLDFLKRYYILMILSLVHPLAMATTQYWGNIIISRDVLGPFRTYDFYLICFLPIFSFIYGCIMYIIAKNVFVSNAIPVIIYFICFGVSYLKDLVFSIDYFYSMLFFTLFPIVFSMMGAGITALIYSIIKSIKENKN